MSLVPAAEPPPKRFNQWIVIGSIFGALTAGLIVWYYVALRPDYAVLYRDLRPQEAAAIVAQLDSEGIAYRLSEGGSQISVTAEDADAIRLKLVSAGVGTGAGDGFELFDDSDMGLTDFAQKIRFQRALQGELARTIMMMEGVVEARVHILIPERGLFRGDRAPSEAAVTLVTRAPGSETREQIEGIQRLIAASVADLAVSDVVVLNARGEVISPAAPDLQSQARPQSLTGVRPTRLERAILTVGRALPGLRFEVSISAAPQAQLSGPAEQIVAQADLRQPQAQAAPARIVRISTEEMLTSAEQEAVRAALDEDDLLETRDNVEFRADLAPALTENIQAPAAQPAPLAQAAPLAQNSTASHDSPPLTAFPMWVLALCGLAGACSIAFFALKPRGTLSAAERVSFAAELKQALQLEDQGARRG